MSLQAHLVDSSVAGRWRIYARLPGTTPVEVTTVRGLPTTIGSVSWEDPYGPKQAELTFPGVTVLDALGHGDLWWLQPDADIDIVWDGPLPAQYPTGGWFRDAAAPAFTPGPLVPTPWSTTQNAWKPMWRWEGFFPSLDAAKGASSGGISITAIGAMRQLDGYLAKPEYPSRPLPYEWAIARQFRDRPALRLGGLRISWPNWWEKVFTPDERAPWYLQPVGVTDGDRWTAYLTRSTGTWNPVLTGYIQQLLLAMYTEKGRFALDLMPGRAPLLLHRSIFSSSQVGFVKVNPVDPGVELDLRIDSSSSLSVVYGQGRAAAGSSYTGMQVSSDGQSTTYRPLAALPQVHPESDARGWLDPAKLRREILLQVQDGLSPDEMMEVGTRHLRRFADPGITGSITLSSAVTMDGQPLHHMLVRAGMSLTLPGLFGRPETVLHVTDAAVNFETGKTTLTVDSKYRDALTVAEVRHRTRDALSVPRMMIAGQYSPPVPDQLVPWNYAEGSGYIPSGPLYNARSLFEGMPKHMEFPWEDWTRQRPPRDPQWRNAYIGIGPKSDNADKNWAYITDRDGARLGFPIKMAQAGQVRLLQLAAYRADGSVAKVYFHFSLYTNRGVNVQAMPVLPASEEINHPPYKAGQHYPFFKTAFERYNADGTLTRPQTPHATETAGLVKAWGLRYAKAGQFPDAGGGAATGLLVDEEVFAFDTTTQASTFDPYSPRGNLTNPFAGMLYAMVFCEHQGTEPVYFLGRMFRVEPSTPS